MNKQKELIELTGKLKLLTEQIVKSNAPYTKDEVVELLQRGVIPIVEEFVSLQSERDRYREALREVSGYNGRYPDGAECGRIARSALREE